MPGDAPSAMPRAWTRRFVTQQGPQFARTEGLFFFPRGNACDDRARGQVFMLDVSTRFFKSGQATLSVASVTDAKAFLAT